ncbi:MAG: hypothetical protein IPO72_05870 [Saprospiraceae bacterium]|nr:hypothetical protein [Candidatus Vicinibacter affinis]MBP6174012.1 hypothetical protein [Saprospiraceae bacterium]MBK6572590.1 hypothetical protein [Candidatus Vicinibacter affinis]MBK7303054.1 hypothetical protein [Candidatus Vicinibacter affinis]MBK7693912.1 hypothetical protein [Candidatus Vicinibacter affinis]
MNFRIQKSILLIVILASFNCHKEVLIQKEPCIKSEAITDSITKVLVFEKKEWPEGYGNAIKINKLGWFKSSGRLYEDRKKFGFF